MAKCTASKTNSKPESRRRALTHTVQGLTNLSIEEGSQRRLPDCGESESELSSPAKKKQEA